MATRFFNLTFAMLSQLIVIDVQSQQADSLVRAEGNILSAESNQPVTARITYKSLPYGNIVGVLNGTAYAFPLFDGDKYSLTVEASGFVTAKYMLDPTEADAEKKIVKHIVLEKGPNGPAVGHVMLLNNLIFQVGKARISEESYPELDLVVRMMQESGSMVVQLEGHTDYQGDARENMKLSEQRVKAVKDYLAGKGISKKRILTKAFGGTKPLSRDNTPEAHRMNRRVELRILKN